jgi:hypothetical protein
MGTKREYESYRKHRRLVLQFEDSRPMLDQQTDVGE